jgi:hypothetical protein
MVIMVIIQNKDLVLKLGSVQKKENKKKVKKICWNYKSKIDSNSIMGNRG